MDGPFRLNSGFLNTFHGSRGTLGLCHGQISDFTPVNKYRQDILNNI